MRPLGYDVDLEDDDLYPKRPHTTVRRYTSVEQRDAPQQQRAVVTRPRPQSVRRPNQYDNVNVYIRRRSAQTPRPQPAPSASRHTEPVQDDNELKTEPLRSTAPAERQKQRWRFHWLVSVGVGMLAMFVLWVVLSGLLSWWGTSQVS